MWDDEVDGGTGESHICKSTLKGSSVALLGETPSRATGSQFFWRELTISVLHPTPYTLHPTPFPQEGLFTNMMHPGGTAIFLHQT